jgi:hypothetical protein
MATQIATKNFSINTNNSTGCTKKLKIKYTFQHFKVHTVIFEGTVASREQEIQ